MKAKPGTKEWDDLIKRLETNDEVLTKLNLWNNQVGARGAASLARALEQNKTLTKFNLSLNQIGAAGAESLTRVLEQNKILTGFVLDHNEIGATGAESLARALGQNKTLTELVFGYNEIGDAGAESLARALEQNKTLIELNIRGNRIGDVGAEFLLRALNKNKTLLDLNLNGNQIKAENLVKIEAVLKRNQGLRDELHEAVKANNLVRVEELVAEGVSLLSVTGENDYTPLHWAVECKHVEVVRYLVQEMHLREISLGTLSKNGKAARELTENPEILALFNKPGEIQKDESNASQQLPKEKSESYQGNRKSDDLIKRLKANDETLTKFDLAFNQIGAAGAESLAKALKHNKTLTELILSINQIGGVGAESLARALEENKTLTKLALAYNEIGAAGAASLARALEENKTLTGLILDHNEIGATGAESLARALGQNKTLTELHLSRNQIGDAGVASLSRALEQNKTLTELVLGHNQIGAVGAESLARALGQNKILTELHLSANEIGAAGAESLAKALEENKTLTKLYLWNNQIGAAGAESLARALEQNKTLTELYLGDNQIGDAGAEFLFQALDKNKALLELGLNGNQIKAENLVKIEAVLKRNRGLRDELHEAAKTNNLARVIELITEGVSLLSEAEENSYTPLHWAVECGHVEVVRYLIHEMRSREIPLDIPSKNGKKASGLTENPEILALFNHVSGSPKIGADLLDAVRKQNPDRVRALIKEIRAFGFSDSMMNEIICMAVSQVYPPKYDCDPAILESAVEIIASLYEIPFTVDELYSIFCKFFSAFKKDITGQEGPEDFKEYFLGKLRNDMEARQVNVFIPSYSSLVAIFDRLKLNDPALYELYLNKHKEIQGDSGVIRLAEALENNTALMQLGAGYKEISDIGVERLALALSQNKSLAALELNGNTIGNDGAKSLANMLRLNNALTTIDLRNNKIGDAGVQYLAESLEENYTLLELKLGENFFGENGKKSLEVINRLLNRNRSLLVDLRAAIKKDDLQAAQDLLRKGVSLSPIFSHESFVGEDFESSLSLDPWLHCLYLGRARIFSYIIIHLEKIGRFRDCLSGGLEIMCSSGGIQFLVSLKKQQLVDSNDKDWNNFLNSPKVDLKNASMLGLELIENVKINKNDFCVRLVNYVKKNNIAILWIKDANGWTALDWALYLGNEELASFFSQEMNKVVSARGMLVDLSADEKERVCFYRSHKTRAYVEAGGSTNIFGELYDYPLETVGPEVSDYFLLGRERVSLLDVEPYINACASRYVGQFEGREVDEANLDKFTGYLTGCSNVREIFEGNKLTYLGHLLSLKGFASDEKLDEVNRVIRFFEGINAELFFVIRARILLELIVQVEKDIIPVSATPEKFKIDVLNKLKQELVVTLEALRVNKNIALFPQKAGLIAKNIAKQVAVLRCGEEYLFASGDNGHQIYITFARLHGSEYENKILVRIDNLGERSKKFHDVAVDKEQCIFPHVFLLNRDFFNPRVPSQFALEYLQLIIESQNASGSDELAQKIYGDGLWGLKRVLTSVDFPKLGLRARHVQTAGNCVVKNHMVGLELRFGLTFYRWFREQEPRFLHLKSLPKALQERSAQAWRTMLPNDAIEGIRKFLKENSVEEIDDQDEKACEIAVVQAVTREIEGSIYEEAKSEYDYQDIHFAVVAGDVGQVEVLLRSDPNAVLAKTKAGYSALDLAYMQNNSACIRLLERQTSGKEVNPKVKAHAKAAYGDSVKQAAIDESGVVVFFRPEKGSRQWEYVLATNDLNAFEYMRKFKINPAYISFLTLFPIVNQLKVGEEERAGLQNRGAIFSLADFAVSINNVLVAKEYKLKPAQVLRRLIAGVNALIYAYKKDILTNQVLDDLKAEFKQRLRGIWNNHDNVPKTIFELAEKLYQDSFEQWLKIEENFCDSELVQFWQPRAVEVLLKASKREGTFVLNRMQELQPALLLDWLCDCPEKLGDKAGIILEQAASNFLLVELTDEALEKVFTDRLRANLGRPKQDVVREWLTCWQSNKESEPELNVWLINWVKNLPLIEHEGFKKALIEIIIQNYKSNQLALWCAQYIEDEFEVMLSGVKAERSWSDWVIAKVIDSVFANPELADFVLQPWLERLSALNSRFENINNAQEVVANGGMAYRIDMRH